MFLLRKPSESEIESLISSQSELPFSYGEVGATRGKAPEGYVVDRYRVGIGYGEEAYERAREALRSWRQFGLGWVSLHPGGAPIKVGTTVAVLARHAGFWSLNPARIIYTVEVRGDVERFGLAYGTLPGHAERGEERFLVEHDRETGPSPTTSSPSPARTIPSRGSATPSRGSCRGASRATRRGRWSGRRRGSPAAGGLRGRPGRRRPSGRRAALTRYLDGL